MLEMELPRVMHPLCIEALIRRHKHQICPTKKYRQSFLAPVILASPPQPWPVFIHYGTYGGAHIHDTIAWDMAEEP